MKILITGGYGFIASEVIRYGIEKHEFLNIDKMTYAANKQALVDVKKHPHYSEMLLDINDVTIELLERFEPDVIMHLAAETHVDRSISDPRPFIETNIYGTFRLLDVSLRYYRSLPEHKKKKFLFQHISTDEVFGSLEENEPAFTEKSLYKPNNPYSASKAASDHFIRTWTHTYGFPAVISNTVNNYGPWQTLDKLIPRMIVRAARLEPLTIHGDGKHIRDWLFVTDHARALLGIAERGVSGQTYLIGGRQPRTNLQVVELICDFVDARLPISGVSRRELISFIADREGNDRRYEVNPQDTEQKLNWRADHDFDSGLKLTVDWYLEHMDTLITSQ